MRGKTVLVTGGAGFIGANLVRTMLSADGIAEVRVLDDRSAGDHGSLIGLDVVDHHASVLDPEALAAAAAGVDAIVHLAARASVPGSISDPVSNHSVNVMGTVGVLQAARRENNAQVVVASSASVYGADPALPTAETSPPAPLSPYASSKLATEADAMAWGAAYDLPVLPLRFFNVYGPHQPPGHIYAAAIPAFAAAVVREQAITVHGDGTQTRDFVFVGDVADLITRSVVEGRTSSVPMNVAAGTRTSLLDIIEMLRRVSVTEIRTEFGPSRAGDIPHSQADITRLREFLPTWAPTPLEQGVATTLEWMRAHLKS